MSDPLLKLARHHAHVHADAHGIAPTPVPALRIVHSTEPRWITLPPARSAVCLTLQGRLSVAVAGHEYECGAGNILVLPSDGPALTRVVHASALEPFVALFFELDLAMIADLAAALDALERSRRPDSTDAEVATVALQLMRIVQQPTSMGLLLDPVLRELHYWLLVGEHGTAIRRIVRSDKALKRVARAIAVIRSDFAKPLPVGQLAAIAGMSPSAFHQHFRATTMFTPLQYQKRIRLMEARRMMLSEGASSSRAAFTVGYQSVPQFTRDYRRMFGLPPRRETTAARRSLKDGRRRIASAPYAIAGAQAAPRSVAMAT